ncbi:MAG: MarR family winged helix-turn-helix transcriptional regulator [Archangium sp.]|nr:MarR family winged helix-turn-helix transcriptional regulator [Archangium sp.]
MTRRARLTPHELLVLAWIAQKPGIGVGSVARCLGRKRQSVQRTLERLEKRKLVERFQSCVRDRTSGWGLTKKGDEFWAQLAVELREQDERLHRSGLMTQEHLKALEKLMKDLKQHSAGMSALGLVEVPPEEPTAEWDH